MPPPRFAARLLPLGMMLLGAGMVSGQQYPDKPIRIVTTEPGSNSDLMARQLAPAISISLGQQLVVDNRGSIGIEIVARAPHDGYTLLMYGTTFWLLPFMRSGVSWDPVKDFSPLSLLATTPNVLLVHPTLPVKSVRELIALAKAKPGELNYSSAPAGATNHLAAELFKSLAGVDIVRIPYKGAGPAVNALVAGQVNLMINSVGVVLPHVKSGRLVALAVTSAQPSALLPGLPTMASSGVPGYEAASLTGMFAPAKTTQAIIKVLNRAFVSPLNEPAVKERFLGIGVETVGSSPEQLAATMKADMIKWGKVIKDAGIRYD